MAERQIAISIPTEPRIAMTAGGVRSLYGEQAAERVAQQIGWSREREASGEVLFWGKVLECLSQKAAREAGSPTEHAEGLMT